MVNELKYRSHVNSHGKLEPPLYKKLYKVMMEIYKDFCVTLTKAEFYLVKVGMKDTIKQVNKEAQRCICTELGPKNKSIK